MTGRSPDDRRAVGELPYHAGSTVDGRREEAILPRQVFDTQLVPAADRFDRWADFVVGAGPASIWTDRSVPFDAVAQLIDLDGVHLTSFRYPTLRTRRTARQIRQADPEMFQLALPIAGFSAISQARNESTIDRTAFTFFDTSRPYEAEHRAPDTAYTSTICLHIPHARLPLSPDRVNRLLAAVMPAEQGMGRLLAQFLKQVVTHPEQYASAEAPRLGEVALDLVCATLARHADAATCLPPETREQVTRLQVTEFIERHLAQPDLDPETVARAHHVSLRTLHRLFADGDETVAGLIRRRRLERCRRDLRNPVLRDQPIHVIAARWGFRDPAHFSRAFRAAYGVPARDYRAGGSPTTGRPG
ncbi:helix-turn-helix domain-containing protein [Micromonospora coerulea]|uniref:AraC-like ligand-binding domain-containing protein n=1 Tax=Micromonospora coerulea TaxID=47856 RepID=UPI001906E5A1|nr:helix-turn-helix domain-containing protein [Micromonospora veneta]